MSIHKSLAFSFLDRYASLLTVMLSSMVIARLLTPNEIGIFSVTMVLLSYVSTVRDMGAGNYLVQEKELTTERIRAVWTVQLGLGFGAAVLVLVASRPIAHFYEEPQMFGILLVVACNYAINPFGSLTYSWLMREMRFQAVALMRFTSSLTAASISVYLAYQDFGAISLAYGSLAGTTSNAVIAVFLRPATFPWLPGTRELRRVLTFGTHLTGSSLLTTLTTSTPELMLGKWHGLTAAGFLSRANGLVSLLHRLFIDAVSAVCVPWFAQYARAHQSVSVPFLKAVSYTTALGGSYCLTLLCLAHPTMLILYGPQWVPAVETTRLLAIAALASVPSVLCPMAQMATGAVTLLSRTTGVTCGVSLVCIATGAWFGSFSLGLGLILAALINSFIWLRITCRHLGVTSLSLVLTIGQSLGVSLCAAAAPAFVAWSAGLQPQNQLLSLGIGGSGAILGFLAGIVLFHHPILQELHRIWKTYCTVFRK